MLGLTELRVISRHFTWKQANLASDKKIAAKGRSSGWSKIDYFPRKDGRGILRRWTVTERSRV